MPATKKILQSPALQKSVQLLATGMSHNKIAAEVGVHQSTVSRVAANPDVRAIIDKITLDSITELAPVIYDNRSRRITLANQTIKSMQDPINNPLPEGIERDEIIKIQELAQKDEVKIEQNIGIAPTHTLPFAVQNLNIYNDNRQTISDTVLSALTGNAMRSTELPDDIVIDVDSSSSESVKDGCSPDKSVDSDDTV